MEILKNINLFKLDNVDHSNLKYKETKYIKKEIGLNKLKIGQMVQVVDLLQISNQYYRQRLLAQGVVPGVIMKIKNIAPLGDPIELSLPSGRSFIVRENEASIIKIITLDA